MSKQKWFKIVFLNTVIFVFFYSVLFLLFQYRLKQKDFQGQLKNYLHCHIDKAYAVEKISLSLALNIKIYNLEISQDQDFNNQEPLLQAPKITLHPRLLSLWQDKIIINKVTFTNLTTHLPMSSNGIPDSLGQINRFLGRAPKSATQPAQNPLGTDGSKETLSPSPEQGKSHNCRITKNRAVAFAPKEKLHIQLEKSHGFFYLPLFSKVEEVEDDSSQKAPFTQSVKISYYYRLYIEKLNGSLHLAPQNSRQNSTFELYGNIQLSQQQKLIRSITQGILEIDQGTRMGRLQLSGEMIPNKGLKSHILIPYLKASYLNHLIDLEFPSNSAIAGWAQHISAELARRAMGRYGKIDGGYLSAEFNVTSLAPRFVSKDSTKDSTKDSSATGAQKKASTLAKAFKETGFQQAQKLSRDMDLWPAEGAHPIQQGQSNRSLFQPLTQQKKLGIRTYQAFGQGWAQAKQNRQLNKGDKTSPSQGPKGLNTFLRYNISFMNLRIREDGKKKNSILQPTTFSTGGFAWFSPYMHAWSNNLFHNKDLKASHFVLWSRPWLNQSFRLTKAFAWLPQIDLDKIWARYHRFKNIRAKGHLSFYGGINRHKADQGEDFSQSFVLETTGKDILVRFRGLPWSRQKLRLAIKSLKIHADSQKLSANMDMRLDDSPFEAKIKGKSQTTWDEMLFHDHFAKSEWQADLKGKKLEFDLLYTLYEAVAQRVKQFSVHSKNRYDKEAFANKTLGKIAKSLTMDLNFDFDQLDFYGADFRPFVMVIKQRPYRLWLDKLRLKGYGGSFSLQAYMKYRYMYPYLRFQAIISKLNLSKLQQDLLHPSLVSKKLGRDTLGGQMDLLYTFSSSGAHINQFHKNLNSDLEITIKNGYMRNLPVLEKWQAASQRFNLQKQLKDITFDKFKIERSDTYYISKIDHISLSAPGLQLDGSGRVYDEKGNRLYVQVRFSDPYVTRSQYAHYRTLGFFGNMKIDLK